MGNVGGCFSFSLVIVRRRLPRPSVSLVTSAYIVSSKDVYMQQRGVGVRLLRDSKQSFFLKVNICV